MQRSDVLARTALVLVMRKEGAIKVDKRRDQSDQEEADARVCLHSW